MATHGDHYYQPISLNSVEETIKVRNNLIFNQLNSGVAVATS